MEKRRGTERGRGRVGKEREGKKDRQGETDRCKQRAREKKKEIHPHTHLGTLLAGAGR